MSPEFLNSIARSNTSRHPRWTDDLTRVADSLLQRGWWLATAESCTGGALAAACTDRAGASAWLGCGWVTYSNAAKTALLGVPAPLIAQHGAVSEPVARAMAEGALARAQAQVAVAVTGIAGPGGGTVTKPVGTVWVAWAFAGRTDAVCHRFSGDRQAVRQATVAAALAGLANRLVALP
jgi:nicotinamide-nucleotide amidase